MTKMPKPKLSSEQQRKDKNAAKMRKWRADKKLKAIDNMPSEAELKEMFPEPQTDGLSKKKSQTVGDLTVKDSLVDMLYMDRARKEQAKFLDRQIAEGKIATGTGDAKAPLGLDKSKAPHGGDGSINEFQPNTWAHKMFQVEDIEMTSEPVNVEHEITSYGDGFKLKDSGERQTFETGAKRDTQGGKGRFDLIPAYPLFRLAKLYEAGAKKYDERNWEKGIPTGRYIDSAFRHLMNFMDGEKTEDHLAAVMWNICGLIWTQEQVKRGNLPKSLLTLPGENDGPKTK